jgi:hypothetical protein
VTRETAMSAPAADEEDAALDSMMSVSRIEK